MEFYSFALQFAAFSGAIVIALSSSDEKLKIARKLGAKHFINYARVPNWNEEVMEIVSCMFSCVSIFIPRFVRPKDAALTMLSR
jgi:D-arabinose 1-dehydrogenase-like Zn-dependent alcohol dehydrogenase